MKAKKLTSRQKLGGAAVIVVALLVLVYQWRSYLHSPMRVVHLTFSALNRHDAEALAQLASEKERRALNLTPQTVTTCLRETYWRNNSIRPTAIVGQQKNIYADILSYPVEVVGFSPKGKPQLFELKVFQEANGEWRVGLSGLLYDLSRVEKETVDDYGLVWDDLARRSSITGVIIAPDTTRYTDGTYSPQISLTRN